MLKVTGKKEINKAENMEMGKNTKKGCKVKVKDGAVLFLPLLRTSIVRWPVTIQIYPLFSSGMPCPGASGKQTINSFRSTLKMHFFHCIAFNSPYHLSALCVCMCVCVCVCVCMHVCVCVCLLCFLQCADENVHAPFSPTSAL